MQNFNFKALSHKIESNANWNDRIGAFGKGNCCSLSLWRVARGSKLMFLELIHGLFIT